MNRVDHSNMDIKIPQGFMVFISGVPGVGKTTISYELLRTFSEFRIIEETDIIREILRGYNRHIEGVFGDKASFIFDEIDIYDNTRFLTFAEAKKQCKHMKKSLEQVVIRQQRKGIPSIINGVHIVPEVLDGIAGNQNVIFINLFISNADAIYNRLKSREPDKYNPSIVPTVFQTNANLRTSTLNVAERSPNIFNNIDVTNLNKEETLCEVVRCIGRLIESKN